MASPPQPPDSPFEAPAPAVRGPGLWSRVIVHADMDAFFAAVEELDEPSLRGKPMLVGGAGPRSVVATANYAARKFGVGSAMPTATALRRCPHIIIRPPRFSRYQEISKRIMGVFSTFAEHIQPLSLDEAFLDMTATASRWASPHALGAEIKTAVFEATGLRVSVGVADTRYVAKVASDHQKPDGLTVVQPHEAIAFLAPLPVRKLWGAGPKTAERLQALGLNTIADVAAADVGVLTAALGSAGHHFWRLAHNDDPRPVANDRTRKSVGAERTLLTDIVGAAAIEPHLRNAAEEVAKRLEAKHLSAHGVRVKLKTARFQIQSRQVRLPHPVHGLEDLFQTGMGLLRHFELSEPVRLVGITAYDLVADSAGLPEQLSFVGW